MIAETGTPEQLKLSLLRMNWVTLDCGHEVEMLSAQSLQMNLLVLQMVGCPACQAEAHNIWRREELLDDN